MAAPDSQISHADSKAYWEGIDADVNGMLGGYPYVSRVDLQGSKNFLAKLGIGGRKASLRGKEDDAGERADGKISRAVDCGAG
jgi:protein N-terminal methyltransferase